jgi:hypothetical protein
MFPKCATNGQKALVLINLVLLVHSDAPLSTALFARAFEFLTISDYSVSGGSNVKY